MDIMTLEEAKRYTREKIKEAGGMTSEGVQQIVTSEVTKAIENSDKFSQLSEQIVEQENDLSIILNHEIEEVDTIVTDEVSGAYVNGSGNEEKKSWYYYKVVSVKDVDYIFVNGGLSTNNDVKVVFKDGNGKVISYVSSANEIKEKIEVPSNATECIVNTYNLGDNFIYSYKLMKSFNYDSLSENTLTRLQGCRLEFKKLEDCYIDYTNGKSSNLNGINSTDYIKVIPSAELVITGIELRKGDLMGLAFYNEYKSYISGVQYGQKSKLSIKVPDKAYYVRFSLFGTTQAYMLASDVITSATHSFLLQNGNTSPLSRLIEFGGNASCFKTIVCIGDSLTEGNCNYKTKNGVSVSGEYASDFTSYPFQLARMTGATVNKCGKGGATATNSAQAEADNHSWLKIADFTNNKWLDADKKAQAYIIALGTNDIGYYGSFDGDVSTDIDSSDYNNNAKTSVGGYATIIQRILSIEPRAKIFCCTIPSTRNSESTRNEANAKIKAIAEMFGCYVIDMAEHHIINKETDYNGGHLNAIGYRKLAVEINTWIDYIISNNIDDFKNIQFIGTEYEY